MTNKRKNLTRRRKGKTFKNKSVEVNWIKNDKAISLIESSGLTIFIGKIKNVYYFAKEVVVSEEKEKNFSDLRTLNPLLEDIDLALLTTSKGLFYWHRNNKFCSFCGSSSIPDNLGHSRICTNCNKRIFPRIDPAVIMLITHKNFCLLGRQRSWPEGMHSTLAGFVEQGETLEQAVERETFEEAGIKIENIKYQYSQPWPFPSSIMLGYRAESKNKKLNINFDELEKADWYSKEFLRSSPENNSFRMPGRISIARRLIEEWLKEN